MALYALSQDDIVTSVIFVVVGLIAIRAFAWNHVKNLIARGWLTNHGTIEFGSVEAHRARYFTYYIARLDYSYSVNSEYYSGYMLRIFLRESSADKFVTAMKGKMVFVRSNPRKPEQSALLKNDQPGGWPA